MRSSERLSTGIRRIATKSSVLDIASLICTSVHAEISIFWTTAGGPSLVHRDFDVLTQVKSFGDDWIVVDGLVEKLTAPLVDEVDLPVVVVANKFRYLDEQIVPEIYHLFSGAKLVFELLQDVVHFFNQPVVTFGKPTYIH